MFVCLCYWLLLLLLPHTHPSLSHVCERVDRVRRLHVASPRTDPLTSLPMVLTLTTGSITFAACGRSYECRCDGGSRRGCRESVLISWWRFRELWGAWRLPAGSELNGKWEWGGNLCFFLIIHAWLPRVPVSCILHVTFSCPSFTAYLPWQNYFSSFSLDELFFKVHEVIPLMSSGSEGSCCIYGLESFSPH